MQVRNAQNLARINPSIFTEEQRAEVEKQAQSLGMDSDLDPTFLSVAKAAVEGFISGFTTINIGGEPTNTAEAIAQSIGGVFGFMGILPGPGIGARLRAHTLGKTTGLSKMFKAQNPLTLHIPSLPFYASRKIMEGASAIAPKREFLTFVRNEQARFKTRDILKEGVSLGLASGAAAWQGGLGEMVNSALIGGVEGIGFRAITNFVDVGKMVTSLNQSERKIGNAAVRAISSGIYSGGLSTGRGDPTELQIYHYLLGGVFGVIDQPYETRRADDFIRRHVENPEVKHEDAPLLTSLGRMMHVDELPAFKDEPQAVKDELLNQRALRGLRLMQTPDGTQITEAGGVFIKLWQDIAKQRGAEDILKESDLPDLPEEAMERLHERLQKTVTDAYDDAVKEFELTKATLEDLSLIKLSEAEEGLNAIATKNLYAHSQKLLDMERVFNEHETPSDFQSPILALSEKIAIGQGGEKTGADFINIFAGAYSRALQASGANEVVNRGKTYIKPTEGTWDNFLQEIRGNSVSQHLDLEDGGSDWTVLRQAYLNTANRTERIRKKVKVFDKSYDESTGEWQTRRFADTTEKDLQGREVAEYDGLDQTTKIAGELGIGTFKVSQVGVVDGVKGKEIHRLRKYVKKAEGESKKDYNRRLMRMLYDADFGIRYSTEPLFGLKSPYGDVDADKALIEYMVDAYRDNYSFMLFNKEKGQIVHGDGFIANIERGADGIERLLPQSDIRIMELMNRIDREAPVRDQILDLIGMTGGQDVRAEMERRADEFLRKIDENNYDFRDSVDPGEYQSIENKFLLDALTQMRMVEKFNGDALTFSDISRFKDKSIFINDVVEWNKRGQLMADKNFLLDPYLFNAKDKPLLSTFSNLDLGKKVQQQGGYRSIIMDANQVFNLNRGDFIGDSYAFIDGRFHVVSDLPATDDRVVAVRDGRNWVLDDVANDGSVLVHQDVFDRQVMAQGLDAETGSLKTSFVFSTPEEGGFMSKHAQYRASEALSRAMEQMGVEQIIFDSAAKQRGLRSKYGVVIEPDATGKEIHNFALIDEQTDQVSNLTRDVPEENFVKFKLSNRDQDRIRNRETRMIARVQSRYQNQKIGKGDIAYAEIGGEKFRIVGQGKKTVDELGGIDAAMRKLGIKSEEDASASVQKFLRGESAMFISNIEPYAYSEQSANQYRLRTDPFVVPFDGIHVNNSSSPHFKKNLQNQHLFKQLFSTITDPQTIKHFVNSVIAPAIQGDRDLNGRIRDYMTSKVDGDLEEFDTDALGIDLIYEIISPRDVYGYRNEWTNNRLKLFDKVSKDLFNKSELFFDEDGFISTETLKDVENFMDFDGSSDAILSLAGQQGMITPAVADMPGVNEYYQNVLKNYTLNRALKPRIKESASVVMTPQFGSFLGGTVDGKAAPPIVEKGTFYLHESMKQMPIRYVDDKGEFYDTTLGEAWAKQTSFRSTVDSNRDQIARLVAERKGYENQIKAHRNLSRAQKKDATPVAELKKAIAKVQSSIDALTTTTNKLEDIYGNPKIDRMFEFLVIRSPASTPSGIRPLQFKGFVDGTKGNNILLNTVDMRMFGGADFDIDKATIYQSVDRPADYKSDRPIADYFNRPEIRDMWHIDKDPRRPMVDVRNSEFANMVTRDLEAVDKTPMAMLDPFTRFTVHRGASIGNNMVSPVAIAGQREIALFNSKYRGVERVRDLDKKNKVKREMLESDAIQFNLNNDTYRPLSTYYKLDVPIKDNDGRIYYTTEAYYHAQRFKGNKARDRFTGADVTGERAAEMARDKRYKTREDWDEIKLDVIAEAQQKKFEANPDLLEVLRSTGDKQLVEWSNNSFTGYNRKTEQGRNVVGKVLEDIRGYYNRRDPNYELVKDDNTMTFRPSDKILKAAWQKAFPGKKWREDRLQKLRDANIMRAPFRGDLDDFFLKRFALMELSVDAAKKPNLQLNQADIGRIFSFDTFDWSKMNNVNYVEPNERTPLLLERMKDGSHRGLEITLKLDDQDIGVPIPALTDLVFKTRKTEWQFGDVDNLARSQNIPEMLRKIQNVSPDMMNAYYQVLALPQMQALRYRPTALGEPVDYKDPSGSMSRMFPYLSRLYGNGASLIEALWNQKNHYEKGSMQHAIANEIFDNLFFSNGIVSSSPEYLQKVMNNPSRKAHVLREQMANMASVPYMMDASYEFRDNVVPLGVAEGDAVQAMKTIAVRVGELKRGILVSKNPEGTSARMRFIKKKVPREDQSINDFIADEKQKVIAEIQLESFGSKIPKMELSDLFDAYYVQSIFPTKEIDAASLEALTKHFYDSTGTEYTDESIEREVNKELKKTKFTREAFSAPAIGIKAKQKYLWYYNAVNQAGFADIRQYADLFGHVRIVGRERPLTDHTEFLKKAERAIGLDGALREFFHPTRVTESSDETIKKIAAQSKNRESGRKFWELVQGEELPEFNWDLDTEHGRTMTDLRNAAIDFIERYPEMIADLPDLFEHFGQMDSGITVTPTLAGTTEAMRVLYAMQAWNKRSHMKDLKPGLWSTFFHPQTVGETLRPHDFDSDQYFLEFRRVGVHGDDGELQVVDKLVKAPFSHMDAMTRMFEQLENMKDDEHFEVQKRVNLIVDAVKTFTPQGDDWRDVFKAFVAHYESGNRGGEYQKAYEKHEAYMQNLLRREYEVGDNVFKGEEIFGSNVFSGLLPRLVKQFTDFMRDNHIYNQRQTMHYMDKRGVTTGTDLAKTIIDDFFQLNYVDKAHTITNLMATLKDIQLASKDARIVVQQLRKYKSFKDQGIENPQDIFEPHELEFWYNTTNRINSEIRDYDAEVNLQNIITKMRAPLDKQTWTEWQEGNYWPHVKFENEKVVSDWVDSLFKDWEKSHETITYDQIMLAKWAARNGYLPDAGVSDWVRQTLLRPDVDADGNPVGDISPDLLEVYIPGALKSRGHATIPGWDTSPRALLDYGRQIVNAKYNLLKAIVGRHMVQEFDLKNRKMTDETRQEWKTYMTRYVDQAIGRSGSWSPEVMQDMRKALARPFTSLAWVPYADDYLEQKVARKYPEWYRKKTKNDPRGFKRYLRHMAHLEGRYELLTLLANTKSAINDWFGGSMMTVQNTGWQYYWNSMFPSKMSRYFNDLELRQLAKDPRWWDRMVMENGGMESFMNYEVGEGIGLRGREDFVRVMSNILSKTSDVVSTMKDRKQFESLKETDPSLWNDMMELGRGVMDAGAWMKRTVEYKTRRQAWIAHYLKARETFGANDMSMEYNHPLLIEAANRGVAVTQFLYSNVSKPEFMRTSVGQVFTRFQNWMFNAMRYRYRSFKETQALGFRRGTPEQQKFERMNLIDMFVMGLASMLPATIFDATLPSPWNEFKDVAEVVFGDEDDWLNNLENPQFFSPVQRVFAPITRIPIDTFRVTMQAMLGGDMNRFLDYHLWTWFPFGPQARNIYKTVTNPSWAIEYNTGFPLHRWGRQIVEMGDSEAERFGTMLAVPMAEELEELQQQ